MEMYGVIENLQQTIQQMEAKQTGKLPSNLSFQRDPQLPNPTAQHSSPTSIVCDREILLSSLNQISTMIKQIVTDSDLSGYQLRSDLKSVLDILDQLLFLFE